MKNPQPKFCYACGNSLTRETVDGHLRFVCNQCHTVTYINSKPCVGALIIRDERILLTQRKNSPFQGFWDIPGGFLESGEHPEAGLRRELQEELGMELTIESLFGIFMDTYGEKGAPTLNIIYQCQHLYEPRFTHDDIVDYQWFSLNNLPANIAFKSTQEALDQLTLS
jgi:ADP-ribose pyrophosphatase YjhB (NUDIX family)